MKTCENCPKEHNGNYGSGRFCSLKCSRSFSTKAKRKEINEAVSKKLSIKPISKHCEVCNTIFETKRNRKCCSDECSKKVQIGVSKKGNYKNNGGIRTGGGRSISIKYKDLTGNEISLNKDEIEVVKILNDKGIKWERNWNYFNYLDKDNNKRRFYPDFYLPDLNLYLEFKGWLSDKMRHKMKSSLLLNNFKLLIVVGRDKRFINDGITIDKLKTYVVG